MKRVIKKVNLTLSKTNDLVWGCGKGGKGERGRGWGNGGFIGCHRCNERTMDDTCMSTSHPT